MRIVFSIDLTRTRTDTSRLLLASYHAAPTAGRDDDRGRHTLAASFSEACVKLGPDSAFSGFPSEAYIADDACGRRLGYWRLGLPSSTWSSASGANADSP